MVNLWCYLEGESLKGTFLISVSPDLSINGLIERIYQHFEYSVHCGRSRLSFTKVDVKMDDETLKGVNAGKYRSTSNDLQQVLYATKTIADIWTDEPPPGHLQVVVGFATHITPTKSILGIGEIDNEINKKLNSLHMIVETFLKSKPPTWTPPDHLRPIDQKFLVNLQIPSYQDGLPSLLLHDIGVYDNEEIKTIFGPSSNKYVCISNTPGSGKTRRMLEGLSKYWGLYLTVPDATGVGVRELQRTLDRLAQNPEWVPDLENVEKGKRAAQDFVNRRIASNHLRKVFAARIVVLDLFLQVAIEVDGTLQDKHRLSWLNFQMSDNLPFSGDSHPFDQIISCLQSSSNEALDTLIERFHGIRNKYLPKSHFIVELDEAQRASRTFPRCFVSPTNPDKFQSIISEVINVFADSLPQTKFIAAGTGLSLAELKESMPVASGVSGPAEEIQVFDVFDMFDTREKLESFVKRYIPGSILKSDSGKRLQQRMREHLHGRYRFSASFVEILLRNNLKSPHKLLTAYIERLTGCLPGDTGVPFSLDEPDLGIEVQVLGFGWDRIHLGSNSVTEAARVVQSYFLTGSPPTYGLITDRLVEYGLARFHRAHNTEYKEAEILEPIAFLSLMRWLQAQDNHSLESNLRLRLGDESARGHAFEEVANLFLLQVLRYPVRFTKVFKFCSQCIPTWADEEAQIVARLDKVNVPVDLLGVAPQNPSVSVAHYAKTIEDVIGWVDNPASGNCGESYQAL